MRVMRRSLGRDGTVTVNEANWKLTPLEDSKFALHEFILPADVDGKKCFNLLNSTGKQERTLAAFTRNAERLISSSDNRFEWRWRTESGGLDVQPVHGELRLGARREEVALEGRVDVDQVEEDRDEEAVARG